MTAAFRIKDDPSYLFTLRFRLNGKPLTIHAWDGGTADFRTGHHRIDACLDYAGTRIFARGDTWCAVNACTAIDGKAAKRLVCSLFAVKPGDTDADYFAGYTPAQLEWAEDHGEELSMLALSRFGED